MRKEDVTGALLAGGRSLRFGQEKALYPLAGRPMAAWALAALEPHTARQVVLTREPAVGEALGLPWRPDRVAGLGPVGGLLTALEWASEEGWGAVFLLACDLPLVGPERVGRILRAWPPGALAVAPASPGPRGREPLCAGYAPAALETVRTCVRMGVRTMVDVLDRLGAATVPAKLLGSPEELGRAFTNVNTREAAAAVEALLQ